VSPVLLVNYARALDDLDRREEAADYAERGRRRPQRSATISLGASTSV